MHPRIELILTFVIRYSDSPSSSLMSWRDLGFITGEFEPTESAKGNVARSMFYFFTMYQQEALEADPDYFESMRNDLCQWHVMDETDANEIKFTNLIAKVQDDKANPFVLDCSLALRSHCAHLEFTCNDRITSTIDITNYNIVTVYPNPSDGTINIQSTEGIGSRNLLIYNSRGQLVLSQSINGNLINKKLDLPAGLYTLQLIGRDNLNYSSRFIIKYLYLRSI